MRARETSRPLPQECLRPVSPTLDLCVRVHLVSKIYASVKAVKRPRVQISEVYGRRSWRQLKQEVIFGQRSTGEWVFGMSTGHHCGYRIREGGIEGHLSLRAYNLYLIE